MRDNPGGGELDPTKGVRKRCKTVLAGNTQALFTKKMKVETDLWSFYCGKI